jgi:hypothetical protein
MACDRAQPGKGERRVFSRWIARRPRTYGRPVPGEREPTSTSTSSRGGEPLGGGFAAEVVGVH